MRFGEASQTGEMAEWLKAHAWKACLGETLTWVRIPLSPPLSPVPSVHQQIARFDYPDPVGGLEFVLPEPLCFTPSQGTTDCFENAFNHRVRTGQRLVRQYIIALYIWYFESGDTVHLLSLQPEVW